MTIDYQCPMVYGDTGGIRVSPYTCQQNTGTGRYGTADTAYPYSVYGYAYSKFHPYTGSQNTGDTVEPSTDGNTRLPRGYASPPEDMYDKHLCGSYKYGMNPMLAYTIHTLRMIRNIALVLADLYYDTANIL